MIDVELGKFLVLMAFSRICRVGFWIYMKFWFEYCDYFLLTGDLIHTICIIDFMLIFVKNQRSDGLLIVN